MLPVDTAGARVLIEDRAISYSPSATLLRRDESERREAPARTLLAFGNPHAPNVADQHGPQIVAALRSAGDDADSTLPPLPHAEEEVRAIGDLVGGDVYTGAQARKDLFLAEAQNYRILHIAAHNLADDHQPLYSRLVLAGSGEADPQGAASSLHAYEVFNLPLRADLVVLSACNSGVGKLSGGEGLLGMTRGFFAAGARSLLVSLWSVDDRATGELMTSFYRNLRDGLDRRDALRQAKISYLQKTDRNPFYWGAFVLLGDTGPIPIERRLPFWVLLGAALIITVALILAMRALRSKLRIEWVKNGTRPA
jgi:CHAT domain-containing protein